MGGRVLRAGWSLFRWPWRRWTILTGARFRLLRPLRRFCLLTLEPGRGLTSGPLHVDERVLHYIAGTNRLDPHLEDLIFLKQPPRWMDGDHFRLATETLGRFNGERCPAKILHLCGDDPLGQESVASLLAYRSGRELYVLRHEDTPAAGAQLEQFLHLWMREQLLVPAFLLLQWRNESPSAAARQLAERLPAPLIIASREPLRLHRAVESFQVDKPGPGGAATALAGCVGGCARDCARAARTCGATVPAECRDHCFHRRLGGACRACACGSG